MGWKMPEKTPDSMADAVDRLPTKDEAAAAQIFDRYANKLIAVAYQRLDQRLRQRVDPEDVVQSVFRTFFRRGAEGEFSSVDDAQDLWKLLVTLTRRRCAGVAREEGSQKRDYRRELADEFDMQLLAQDPAPEDGDALLAVLEEVLSELGELELKIVELRLAKYTLPEISKQAGCSETKVSRVLRWLKENLNRELNGEETQPLE
jgi:RNA polymerase sigma factor (sigma-70 family)